MSQQRLQIIHVVPAITEEASGPSYSVVRLCEALLALCQEVTLVALDWAPMHSSLSFLRNFPLSWGPRRLGRSPEMKRWLIQLMASGTVDVIHNHSLWMMPNVYCGQAAYRTNVPLVVSPRGTLSEWAMQSGSSVKKIFWPLIQRPALVPAACFHATAASEYDEIRRMGFGQPVAIIPNGIDIRDFIPKTSGKFRTLLYLGRIHPKKGLDLLLRAWRVLQDRYPEWNLRIVGPDNGGYLEQLQRLAAELSLERIQFSGPLFGKHKLKAYSQADLFVLPTYSENFGIAVAEALAAGTAAIVTKGAPWAGLEQRRAGWWIDIGVDALVACLENALSHPAESLAAMGWRGRCWMEAEYSWAQIGQQMAQTYGWLLRGGDKPQWVVED